MDINDARMIITVITFATFVGIVLWACSGKRKAAFEDAAQLPFRDDDDVPGARSAGKPAARKQGG